MTINFTDPVLWMCVGILLIGLLFLVWAIGKLKTKPQAASNDLPFEMPSDISQDRDLPPFEITQVEPKRTEKINFTPSSSSPATALAGNSAFNKEMVDRLETMSQRLADMQGVLTKQAGTPTIGGAPSGGIGQGFSPETIDKLLKIIGGVVQQVDLLQKSLTFPDGTAAPAKSAVAAPIPIPSGMSPMGSLSATQKMKPNP